MFFIASQGKFDSKEKSWLVIWEADIVVELPPGVFFLYPSSIFFHCNVHRKGKSDFINFPSTETDRVLQTLTL
jgi:hypothetical protein